MDEPEEGAEPALHLDLPAADADTVMAEAVRTAAALAAPGDVVLLAPAAASLDMFDSYGHRGRSFAAAAAALTAADTGRGIEG